VIGPFPGDHSSLSLVWAARDRASEGYRGVSMTSRIRRWLQGLRRELLGASPQSNPDDG
jgi:hypothetical protein